MVVLRRLFAAVLAAFLAVLVAGSVLGGPSGELVLRFPAAWSAGGAAGKKFLVRAGASEFPLVVSGRDVRARPGFYTPGTRLAVFRGGRMLSAAQAGSGGVSTLSPLRCRTESW